MNGLRIVREGVMPEDRVIVKGLQRVQPGIKVDPVEEDIVVDEMNFLMPGS
jgi:multidrug efflux system membrane fusion protein